MSAWIATFRATCPFCGDIEVKSKGMDMVLSLTIPNPGSSRYSFTCPDCKRWIDKPADESVRKLLALGGVPICVVDEAPESCPATPLTQADISAFDHDAGCPDRLAPIAARARTTS